MADFTPKKFIDLAGLKVFYNKHQEQIDNQISTVSSDLAEHKAAADITFDAIEYALNGYVLKVGEDIATMTDINEIITNANTAYTDSAINLALDNLNGEVV